MRLLHEEPRLRVVGEPTTDTTEAFAEDVRSGLTATPKRLSSRFLYDAEGSRLFEEICSQPEYYPTRVEASILRERAHEIYGFFESSGERPDLVELGSGSAEKTRLLLEAGLDRHGSLVYRPIDISPTALEESAHGLIAEMSALEVDAIAGDYMYGLEALEETGRPRLVLWLGSSIGNFDRDEALTFLSALRERLGPTDAILLGIDLRKEKDVLEAAYNDRARVTERFEKNLLTRINRELAADFDLTSFRYRAVWEEEIGRVAMFLYSMREQTVRIAELDLEVAFAAGESIHIESAHKYSLAEIDALAAGAGCEVTRRWLDAEERFSLSLLVSSDR